LRATLRRDVRAIARVVVCFGAIPLLVYLASYAQFWLEHGPALRDWATLQHRMALRVHHGDDESPRPDTGYKPDPYTSQPASWPFLLRPNPVYQDDRRTIVEIGNPVLWWGFLLAAPVLGLALARRRSWRLMFIVGGYLTLYAPWLLFGRHMYLYYMLPAVPFMALGVAAAIEAIQPRTIRRTAAGAVALSAVTVAALFLPLWVGSPTPHYAERLRWLSTWEWRRPADPGGIAVTG
jgi:dolichyl-phosphate-mannose--protein O-mannosyl transferase